jgi:acyl-CoA synthetase (AMP-forming)/AMP-acid ligase II
MASALHYTALMAKYDSLRMTDNMTRTTIENSSLPIAWSDSLNNLAKRFGPQIAAIDGHNNHLTYSELNQRAHILAHRLLDGGLQAGQAIASLLPNSIEAVWASYGIRLAGATEIPLSWGYTLEEIQWCAQLTKFKTVLTFEKRTVELQGSGFSTLSAEQVASAPIVPNAPVEPLAPIPFDQSARVLFTSGTTGKPKGVVYTNGARWLGEQLLKATLPFVPEPGVTILLMTPFVHGASLLAFSWLDHGATIILHDGVNIEKIAPLLDANSLDAIFAPPTVLAKITSALAGKRYDQVRCVFTGTQPLTPALYKRAHEMFGAKVRITFGKSECVNPITVLSPQDTHNYYSQTEVPAGACVGWPAPGVEIKIATPDSVSDQDDEHKDGEILLRSPHMSSGLIDSNGFRSHQPEGWHHTGDLGHIDQAGRVVLTGRIADVIKTGGYRVNPDEIEVQLAANTLCAQICVTSLASDYWGEIIVGVAESTQAGWQEQCVALLQSMSRHKRPRLYVAVQALPRNPQGKISRKAVSNLVLTTHKLIDGSHPRLEPLST